jgi:hypothetical protein
LISSHPNLFTQVLIPRIRLASLGFLRLKEQYEQVLAQFGAYVQGYLGSKYQLNLYMAGIVFFHRVQSSSLTGADIGAMTPILQIRRGFELVTC